MSPALAKIIFVFAFALNVLLWSQSRYTIRDASSLQGSHSLVERLLYGSTESAGFEAQCLPLEHPVSNQCIHVIDSCPSSQTFLSFNYLQEYFCTSLPLRPVAFVSLTIWLFFLFSTLGISASDFFTPNLNTLAQILGLDENVAGVTFLAFGNGSPDVFSTFSAMRAGSGSLAIGELLGAATFIVSCVVGSMCITKEFEVERWPFLRDVGFFTVAVSVLLLILWDGKILLLEAGLLVALYVFYVAMVVVGSWWDQRRQGKRMNAIQLPSGSDPVDAPYRDNDEEFPITINVSPASPTQQIQTPIRPRIDTSMTSQNLRPGGSRSTSRSPSPSPSHAKIPSFSLVGALEFAHVVKSLRREAAAPSLEMFDSPVTPYAGGHYHTRHGSRQHTPRTSLSSRDSWDVEAVALSDRSPSRSPIISPFSTEEPRSIFNSQSSDYFGRQPLQLSPLQSNAPIPSIIRTSASPTNSNDSQDQLYVPPTKRQRVWKTLRDIFHTLFPTLHQFRTQSLLSQAVGILATPAVLLLTLTLPVVATPYMKPGASEKHLHHHHHHHSDGRLIDFEEEGEARALIAEEEVLEEMHFMEFNKWLMAAQCVFAPLFCVAVLFSPSQHMTKYLIAATVGGCTTALLVLMFCNKGNHPTAKLARCSMGFLVAMVWIMAIADEIVVVLQTFGFIFGLSDALIGLTFFAVGNSLADLVANMSVAAFAPIMGFSACFGGPMLNILLGIGISGSYVIHQTGTPFLLPFSTTLFVSVVGLLGLLIATLICVPLNKYVLTRRWGILLVSFYAILMTTNVIVEMEHAH